MKYIGWLGLVTGIWVAVSPWILGFSSIDLAFWNNLITGFIIVLLALWHIFGDESAHSQ